MPAPQVGALFPGLTPADLPDREGWAVERIVCVVLCVFSQRWLEFRELLFFFF